VGKHNFRPPPKVESRVVRIELRNPPPPVNFVEWDGMIRLLFNWKNKSLRAVLNTKSVHKLLEENGNTVRFLQSQQQKKKGDSEDVDVAMDERPVAEILDEILEQPNWKDRRASKLDLDDFLTLLAQFNQAGIHFS
jgi:18S rRNA (adenine1779-N6/adenine1780-N6)-dimethyltransferase